MNKSSKIVLLEWAILSYDFKEIREAAMAELTRYSSISAYWLKISIYLINDLVLFYKSKICMFMLRGKNVLSECGDIDYEDIVDESEFTKIYISIFRFVG